MRNIAGDEVYLKTFYQTPEGIQDLRHIALSDLGYFIEDPSAYMDNHITDSIVEDIFSPRFFRLLNDNITFSDENRAKHYFDEIIGILSKQMDLYSLLITENHPFNGSSIRKAAIRESYQALVIAIERNDELMMNPESDEILLSDDIVWIVCEENNVKKIMSLSQEDNS